MPLANINTNKQRNTADTHEDTTRTISPTSLATRASTRRVKRAFKRLRRKVNRMQKFKEATRNIIDVQSDLVEVPGERAGDYRLGKFLACGSFGKVFLGKKDGSDQEVAIKILKTDHQPLEFWEELNREIGALSHHSQHSGVIGLLDVLRSRDKIYLVMEKADVDLYDLFLTTDLPWTQKDFLQQIMLGVLKPIKYLHEHGISHGDLHVGNILIKRNPNGNPKRLDASEIRLADFGLSKMCESYASTQGRGLSQDAAAVITSGNRVCVNIIAPEQWNKDSYDARLCDVWAMGILLSRLALILPMHWNWTCRFRSTYTRVTKKYLQELRNSRGHEAEFDLLLDFLCNLLEMDPKQRTTSAEALNHSWLRFHGSTH